MSMLLRWVLTRDREAVLDLAADYGAVHVEAGNVIPVVPSTWEDEVRAAAGDPSLPPEEIAREAVHRADRTIVPAIRSIYSNLQRGELRAHARRNGSGDLVSIDPAQWNGLRIRGMRGHNLAVPVDVFRRPLPLLRPITDYLTGSVSPAEQPTVWPDPEVPAEDATLLWPDITDNKRVQTIAAERRCVRWLVTLMEAGPTTKGKRQYEAEAKQKFGIGARAFLRAWDDAIKETGSAAWSRPGPKSKQRIETPKKS